MKNLAFLFVIVCGFLVLFFFSCKQNPNEDLSAIEPKMLYSAEKLINTLRINNEYDKEIVIEVSGIIHEINTKNNRTTILLEGALTQEIYVICDMNPNQTTTIKTMKKGDSILIKGLLKGMLKDVIMLNCVIENNH